MGRDGARLCEMVGASVIGRVALGRAGWSG